jgi:hypothetical protein
VEVWKVFLINFLPSGKAVLLALVGIGFSSYIKESEASAFSLTPEKYLQESCFTSVHFITTFYTNFNPTLSNWS